jgi:hypothetical protein
MVDDWLIWSEEHGSWWRAGRRGYTTSILQAGIYTKVQADRIVHDANAHSSNLNEVAIAAPVIVRQARNG